MIIIIIFNTNGTVEVLNIVTFGDLKTYIQYL